MLPELPTFDDVARASERLAGQAHRTPVLTSTTADAIAGASLFFKCENYQRMGAFKFRGGFNAIARLTPEQRAAGVVTFSSGNHAQAIALASRLQGVKATIIMPLDAPAAKRAATEGYGGHIVTYDRYTEDREEIARRIQAETGATLIPPYDHEDVIAGQGTAAKELFEDVGELDYLFVCLGAAACCRGRRCRRSRSVRAAWSTGSSRKPATTANSRCARARSSASRRPRRWPTAPPPRIWAI